MRVSKNAMRAYAVAIPLHGSIVATAEEGPKLSAALYFWSEQAIIVTLGYVS
jgi:hypothetical protein